MAILESLFGDPNESPNMLMRFGAALQGGQAQAAMDEMYRKKREESALAKLAPRIQSGDKAALMELAIINPQAATALSQFAPQSEYKVVGDQLVQITPGAEPKFIEPPSGGKAPANYQWKETPQGRVAEPIPGTEADIKRKEAEKAKIAGDEMATAKIQVVNDSIKDALEWVDTFGTGGIAGALMSYVPGSNAYNLDKTMDTIRANLGFNELQAMRAASPTGGALGSVAVKELEMLQSTIASLAPGLTDAEKIKSLNKIKKHMDKWAETVAKSKESRSDTSSQQSTKKRVKFSDL